MEPADRESSPDMEIERETKPIVIRNTTDLQRLKLEKLMKNPDKPILIPERPKERGVPVVPDFVRNVMGSSAGAGSGEFHVYRHLRRKEYARQKYMKEKGEREKLDNEYHAKLEENKKKAEERTAKKRLKRLKRKQNQKQQKRSRTMSKSSQSGDTATSSSEEESDKNENIQQEKTENEVDISKTNKEVELQENKSEGETSDDTKKANELPKVNETEQDDSNDQTVDKSD